MPKTKHTYDMWRKSSRSNDQGGNCVEVGFTADGAMTGVRDTKEAGHPHRATLEISRNTWATFLDTIRHNTITT